MTWFKAEKTLAAINAMLEKDQGATYRGWLGKVLPHIGDAYSTSTAPFRPHLGASQIGKECNRAIWYSFHWAVRQKFEGRMIRLFNRGHLEEGRLIAMLLAIGVEVYQQDANGKQFRISGANGHYGGSGDGIGLRIPDLAPDTSAVLEFKTSSTKVFDKVAMNGVKSEKFEHYVQMQQYMGKMGYSVALYMMVCKENDHIHAEIVPFDRETYEQYFDRGEKIVFMPTAPDRMRGASPGFFKCKFCDAKGVCFNLEQPDKNCRTCKYSEPLREGVGVWWCNLQRIAITTETQYNGCDKYVKHEAF